MRRFAVLILTVIQTAALSAQDYSVCETVITRGLREYRITSDDEAYLNSVFDNYCESSGEVRSTNVGAAVDTIIKTIPVRFTGTYTNNTDGFKAFCKNYQVVTQTSRHSYTYEETIVSRAYDAFNDCLKFVAQGISMSHNIVSRASLDVSLVPALNRPIKIQGLHASANIRCVGQKPNNQQVNYGSGTHFDVTDRLGFACSRSATRRATDDSLVYDEGTIQLITNVGNYDVFMPRDEKLAENSAAAIRGRLALLTEALASANARITNLKLKVGEARGLGPFDCGGETRIGDGLVAFLVGSRDGTSCNVKNENFYRSLQLVIPPVP